MAYGGNFHISKALSNVSIKYSNNEYVASKVLKDLPVKNESDIIYVYNRDFAVPETRRGNKSPSNMVTWGISTTTYYLDEHALSDVISDRDRNNSDSINLDVDTTEFLTDKILLAQEVDAAALLFTTGTWSNYAQGTTATSWKYNTTTSAPIQMVLSGTSSIVKNSGTKPNTMIVGWATYEVLKENPNVYNRIQYVERAIITEDLLASLFDVQTFVVGAAVMDTPIQADAESISFIWGGHALLAYMNPKIGLKQVTAAVNLRINEAGNPYKVKKWREEKLGGDQIEVSTMYKPKAIATACGYYFSSVTAS
jgi:hypothetical protein